MNNKEQHKIYFPNLNGIRFIAALLVIIHHIEQIKSISGFTSLSYIPFIEIIGKLGVILFFVLSGFLITFLLLSEEHTFTSINVRKFYIRRILRIWPVYFLVLVLAFGVLPNIRLFVLPGFEKEVVYENLQLKLTLYVLFLPNVVLSLFGVVPYASHTWSIGTEEQFYFVWPIILRFFKKNRLYLMLVIIFLYVAFAAILKAPFSDIVPYKKVIKEFWTTFNIDCMAIGGFFSICLFQKNRILKLLLNKNLFYAVIILTIILMIRGIRIPYVHNDLFAILFGIIILNFAANRKLKISLENKLLNYLGNISYGLYIYHPIAIVLILYLIRIMDISTNWVIYPLSIIISIVFAGLSYRYYESYFLKFKNKFSQILSGNDIEP
jgi:peptidoglycan/LPS O-acetylase OafA/YrhL